MVSAENKSRKKRKDEKTELCSAWESSGADNGSNDDDAFCGWQKAKQHIKERCRYLDERNIVVSPHLLTKTWSSSSEGSDVTEKPCPRCDASRDNAPFNKSHVALPAEPSDLSQNTSDTEYFPINTMSTHSMTHKQNIIYSLSPEQTSILELKQSLPLIRWAPGHMTEDSVPWRCKGFASMNHEARPAEPRHLCKWAAAQSLEWCHESLARLAHLGVQSPNNAPSACRRRPVIRRPIVGHEGVQVHNRHVEKSCRRTSAAKGLPNEDATRLAALVHPCNQALYSCFWSAVKAEAGGHGKELNHQDSSHMFHSERGDISIGCSNVSWMSDVLCPSGRHGNSEASAISHDVTLFHILQVLQSKPVNLPQVRGQRRLKTLSSLNA